MAGVIVITRIASSANYNVAGITSGIANPYTTLALAKTAVEVTTGALTWASQITSSYDERVSAFYETGILPAAIDLPGKLLVATFNDGILKRKFDDSGWEIVTAVEANKLQTTDPADLPIGAVADGQFLKRVGGTIVGAAVGGGGDALVANPLSQFAATTSAQLAGVISDETGAGALVFANSPVLVTPTVASLANMNHSHQNVAGGGTLAEAALALTDVTTADVSISAHGLQKKLPNLAYQRLDGVGAWVNPWDAHRVRPFYATDFIHNMSSGTTQMTTPWFGAVIASGTIAATAASQDHPGILRITASASANSGASYIAGTSAFLISGGENFEIIFSVITTSNTTLYMGYHDATSSTAPTDGCWLDLSGTTLSGKAKNNAGPTTTASTYTITASTWYRGVIVVNSGATLVTFTLYNMAGTVLWTDTVNANIPTAAGRECGNGIVATNNTASGTPNIVDVDYMALWWDTYALVR